MRIATPYFQLFTTPLIQAVEQGKMQKLILEMKKQQTLRELKISSDMLPVGLRWNMHPEFGFPRKPFKVYRRRSVYNDKFHRFTIVSVDVVLNNAVREFSFPQGQEMYLTSVMVTVAPGQRLTITPFDRDRKAMTGKMKTANASESFLFKCPFTAGFVITGTGTLSGITGISMQAMLDADDWELIQITGLPLKSGQIGGPQGYHGDHQGYVAALTDPRTASLQRLKIGELLFITPPSAGDIQVPDPTWKAVDTARYFNDAEGTILPLISDCLTDSDDESYFKKDRQPAFAATITVPGIHQPGGPPPDNADALIPVVGTTLLSISTESPAALCLGFGTTDFVAKAAYAHTANDYKAATTKVNVSTQAFGYDYMVTAQYIVRPYENIPPLPFFNDLSHKTEFCALSDERDLPQAPINPEVLTVRTNRPESADHIFTEAVKLRWDKTALPQGCGLIVSYKNGVSDVLNAPYDFSANAYHNYSTYTPKAQSTNPDEQVLPAEEAGDNDKFVMVQPEEPLPIRGSEVHKYFVAGWDVFGRWSNFIRLNHVAVAPAPQNPGVMSIRLFKTNPDITSDLSPVNPNVPCTLEVELGWNWADRTPSRIEVSGAFFNAANALPPATHPSHFSLTSVDAGTPVISISFDASGNPFISPAIAGISVYKITNTVETPTDLRKIKLVADHIMAAFPAGAPHSIAYAIYVRGLETVRALPMPEDWGDWSEGYQARMEDPRPPAATVLPATVQFTAMPDATKLGRGRLQWPVAANALGYYVWEASETAIRAALDQPLKNDFPGDESRQLRPLTDSLAGRATQLRDLLAQAKYSNLCQRAFNRLTREMIRGTSVELEIPGSSKVMTLYQVSSINTANIESGKSNAVFFAVPQLQKPAAPMLRVVKFKKQDPVTDEEVKGIRVQLLNGNGLIPDGFNLYSTRKIMVGSDVGAMGLPVYEFTDADWKPHTMRMLDGATYSGKYVETAIVHGSWRPYTFQAVAIGQADPTRGLFRGESEPSATETIFFPPDIPPTLLFNGAPAANAASRVIKLRTTAPFDLIDLGKTIIELYSLDADNKRTLLKIFTASETSVAAADLAPASTAVANTWPAIKRKPTNVSTGITLFSIGVKKTVPRLLIRIIDPLGRAAEIAEGP